jgi:hypothetical protein
VEEVIVSLTCTSDSFQIMAFFLNAVLSSFFRLTKPADFSDCIGDELPLGWEEGYHPYVGVYYINHLKRKYCMICF